MVDNTDDLIDVRDVIARVEELRELVSPECTCPVAEVPSLHEPGCPVPAGASDEDLAELNTLEGLLRDLAGNGGDEQWEGDWYPLTLVRDTYFVTFAQELAEDLGAVPSSYTWPTSCIDWEQAARELRMMDYTSVDFDGVTYWAR